MAALRTWRVRQADGHRRAAAGLSAAALALAVLAAAAQLRAQAPTAAEPLIGPLHMATISTADPAAALRFYRDGLGMRARGPVTPDQATAEAERQLWGLPSSARWETYVLDRPEVPGTVQIRLLAFAAAAPPLRTTHDARQPAPFTLGFPTSTIGSWRDALRSLGFETLAPIESYALPRPDGTRYGIQEAIVAAPDFVHAVLIERGDGMSQVGPVDTRTGRGGPVYSAQVVANSDAVIAFYRDVLGFELRSDREWTTSAGSALGVPPGIPFRFSILYAPGAASGHLLLMDFRDRAIAKPAAAPRPPSAGLGMWTFLTRDLDAVAARLRASGVTIVGGSAASQSIELGRHRALSVLAPNGFLVEIAQPEARP